MTGCDNCGASHCPKCHPEPIDTGRIMPTFGYHHHSVPVIPVKFKRWDDAFIHLRGSNLKKYLRRLKKKAGFLFRKNKKLSR